MILDELVLHDFGVYRGRQALSLSPPSSARPVVLIGGLNGAGKTTILDAVQLALYGKLAPCVSRTPGSYHQYLRDAIHRHASPTDGAALELAFRHQHDGAEHRIRVHRRWHANAQSVRERLDVERDGVHDTTLSAHWIQSVDQFVPLGISRLVFFDGEKVAALADPATSAHALAAGINSLLGLDALDRLLADLTVYERRQRSKFVTPDLQQPVRTVQAKLRELAAERSRLVIQRASAQNTLDHARRRLADCEQQFHLSGGDLSTRRAELESQREVLAQRLRDARSHLLAIAAGHEPLLQVQGLLRDLSRRASRESAAADALRIDRLLATRDREVLAKLRDKSLTDVALGKIQAILADDRRRRTPEPAPRSLSLPDSLVHELTKLTTTALPKAKRRLVAALRRTATLQDQLDQVDRDLAAVPDDGDFAALLTARSTAQADADAAERVLGSQETALHQLRHTQDREHKHYERLLVGAATQALDHDDLNRTLDHSAAVRDTLQRFRRVLLTRRARHIASLVLAGFRHLLRKERLVAGLEIDPSSFSLTLRDFYGAELSAASLSSGERQLLAVSLLWGLARAAGRPLPTIVDTPLARLDSTHRAHLVERYFPTASHQVLVLSTDEEITPVYWAKLRPHVGRTYTLVHDDRDTATTIHEGYFGD